jgi:hypothetical protein
MAIHNYSLAFVEYCRGTPVQDIAHILCIPEETLENKIRSEQWGRLRDELPARLPEVAVAPQGAQQLAVRAQLLQENREKNFELWCKLRSDAEGIIDALLAPRLKFKRYWHNKGSIVEKECDVTMADRTALANYLGLIAQGTYLALGDRGATQNGPGSGGDTGGAAAVAPAITIVLPGAVCRPREERSEIQIAPGVTVQKPAQVVDVEEIKPDST